MNVDELLRETAPDPAHLHAEAARLRADVLARATTRRRRSRRPLRAAVAGAAVAAVGFGGVAVATGAVPTWLPGVVDEFGQDQDIPAAERPEMSQIIDLELPDGSRFAAWRGVSDKMWCTAYIDQWDGRSLGTGGAACSDSGPEGYDLNRIQLAWAQAADGSTYYPVLFGDAHPGTVAIRVSGRFEGTGQIVDLTVEVDPATGAFAATLPGTNDHPWAYLQDRLAGVRDSEITLELLDADGAVLRTVEGPSA